MQFIRRHFAVLSILALDVLQIATHFATGTSPFTPLSEETFYYLVTRFVRESFGSGHFPLWCPYFFTGYPFAAWSHSMTFYPLSALFYVASFPWAWTLALLAHVMILHLGLYKSLRYLELGEFTSLIGSGVSVLFVYRVWYFSPFLPDMACLSWCGLVFWNLLVLMREGRTRHVLSFVALFFLQLSTGSVEVMAYQYLLFGAYVLFIYRPRMRGYAVLIPAAALGVAIAAIFWLPSSELYNQSVRSLPMDYKYLTSRTGLGLGLIYMVVLLNFFHLGGFLAGVYLLFSRKKQLGLFILMIFVGLVCVNGFGILRLLGHLPVLGGFRAQYKIVFLLIIFLTLFSATGWREFFAGDESRGNLKGLYPMPFLLLLLGLFYKALSLWVGMDLYREFFGTVAITNIVLAAVFALALLVIWIRFREIRYGRAAAWGLLIIGLYIPVVVRGPAHRGPAIALSDRLTSQLRSQDNIDYRSLYVLRFGHPPRTIPFHTGVLDGTRAIDGFITVPLLNYARYLDLGCAATVRIKDGVLMDNRLIQLIRSGDYMSCGDPGYLNFISLKYLISEEQNVPFSSHHFILFDPEILWEVEDSGAQYPADGVKDGWGAYFKKPFVIIGGYSFQAGDRLEWRLAASGKPGDDFVFTAGIMGPNEDLSDEGSIEHKLAGGGEWRSPEYERALPEPCISTDCTVQMRGRWSSTSAGLTLIDPAIVHEEYRYKLTVMDRFKVFENGSAIPRTRLYSRYRVFPEKGVPVEDTVPKPAELGDWIALYSDPFPGVKNESVAAENTGQITRVEEYGDLLKFDISAGSYSIFSLSDAYYPGWRAYIDGRRAKIMRSNHAFRALAIEPGRHLVEMVYAPFSFKIGLWMCLTSLMVLGLMAFRVFSRKEPQDQSG